MKLMEKDQLVLSDNTVASQVFQYFEQAWYGNQPLIQLYQGQSIHNHILGFTEIIVAKERANLHQHNIDRH